MTAKIDDLVTKLLNIENTHQRRIAIGILFLVLCCVITCFFHLFGLVIQLFPWILIPVMLYFIGFVLDR